MIIIVLIALIAIIVLIAPIDPIKEYYENEFNILSDEPYEIFKEYNYVVYRKFIRTLHQYIQMQKYNDINAKVLNRKLIELYESMTFHIPYMYVRNYARGIKNKLVHKLNEDIKK